MIEFHIWNWSALSSPIRQEEKGGNFKRGILSNWSELFLYYLSSRPILFQWFWENTFDLYFQLHWWTKMNSQQHLQNSSTLFMNIVVFKSSQTKWVPTYTKSQLFKWLKWKSFPFYYDVDIYKNSSWMNNNGKDRLTFPLKWGSKEGLLGLW